MSAPSLTLIVATTSNKGIGLRGKLPWQLKSELAYFARVTTRLPPAAVAADAQNAVIMGRKTWESILARYRPLKNRVNFVISSHVPAERSGRRASDGAVWCRSLNEAVELVRRYNLDPARLNREPRDSRASGGDGDGDGGPKPVADDDCGIVPIARVFVIGGAQVYREAVALQTTRQVLLTRVLGEWECDTFFPIDFDQEPQKWTRESFDALKTWTGEKDLKTAWQREGETEFEYRFYTRKRSP